MKEEFDAIEDKGFGNKFSRWRKKRQINKIEENIDGVEHAGAKGEILALEKLSILPDSYHIFSGKELEFSCLLLASILPSLTTLTTNPYRFILLVILFAIGVSTLLSSKLTKSEGSGVCKS